MRHRNARTKLGRTSSHRRAMISNMLIALVEHGRIKTTERKARELRSAAEKVVTRATSLGDILTKDRESLDQEEAAQVVHAMRMARRTLRSRDSVLRLFEDIAPRYLGRPGGYTRTLKLGFRKGDNASMVILEFVEADMPEMEGQTDGDEKKKGFFDRFRRKKA